LKRVPVGICSTEFSSKYRSTELTVELEEEEKKYRISVVLNAIDE